MITLLRFLFLVVTIFSTFQTTTAADSVKVGVMTHLTGDFAAWGQAYLEGITLGQEKINASGGIRGRNVALEVEDTRFDSALTATAAKKLISVNRVPVAMVSTFTEVMVAGPIFETNKVPLLVFGDSGGKIETLGKFVFSTGTWVDGYALSASKFLAEQKKIKKVAIVATNNAWSQSTAESFRRDFEQRGGRIVYSVDQNPSDTDFRTILEKIRIENVDAVFAPITAGVVPFFEQARRMNMRMPLIAAGGALDSDVIASAPDAVEGRYVTNAFLDSQRAKAAEFLMLYRQRYGKEPMYPSVSARGFDGFTAIVYAIRSAGTMTGEDIRKALSAVDFDGAGFHVKINKRGTASLPVKVLRVEKGHLILAGDS